MIKGSLKSLAGLTFVEIAGTGVMSFSAGVFVLYVTEALHFTRSAFFLINTMTIACSALSLPLFRKLSRHISPSKTVLVCGIASSLIYMLYSLSSSYIHFLILGALNGIFINGISMPLVSPTLKKLFSAKQEFYLGIILGITTLASSVTIRLIRYVNSNFSFRSGYRVIGILGLIFSLVGSYLIKGSRWESVSSLSFFQTIAFIFKKKGTRLISLSLFLGNLINLALFNNLIPYLKDMGISDVKGSALSSTAVFMMLFARPLWGAVFMKMKTKKAFMLLSLSPFITSAFYILAFKNIGFIYPSLIFLSFCSCFNTIPASSFAKIYKEKGSDAFTSFMMSGFLGSAVGSTLAALSFDFSMSYFPAWIAFLCISPVITAMTFFFKEEDVL